MAKLSTLRSSRGPSALFSRIPRPSTASAFARSLRSKTICASWPRPIRSRICALAIERYPTDIVLLEGSLLAGTANVIPDLLRVAPDVKLIVQAVAADENQTVELYRRGVRGIVSRSISPDLLVRCVRRIAAGETWIDNQSVSWVIEAYRAQAAALVNPRTQPKLSPKEMAIITCITQGKRNKEIAFQLGTTEQVIKNYLRKIYDKLGVSDRLELALYCLHNKIIQHRCG